MQSPPRDFMLGIETTPAVDPLPARIMRIRSIQAEQGGPVCFLTDQRLFCDDHGCVWRKECCRLIAAWKR